MLSVIWQAGMESRAKIQRKPKWEMSYKLRITVSEMVVEAM